MVHDADLVLTLAGALGAALIFGLAAQKLRLSPIVGYLAAGVAVGPFTPGFVAHAEVARQFAELGVVLLMFGVGLNLHVDELLAVKWVALPGALASICAAILAGVLLTRAFGFDLGASVVYGVAISIASTVVLLRVFADADLLQTRAGRLAVGWLLVEDLFVVVALVLIPVIAGPRVASAGALFVSVAMAIGKIAMLVALGLLVGRRVVPRVLAYIARTRSRELFTLAVLVMALGVGVAAARFFGASRALGALLAGLVVGQSDFASRAATEALPMRDAFAVLFFVATGMLLDPTQLAHTLPLALATIAVVWLAKPLVALLVLLAFRHPPKTALSVAIGLAQIGEFSFVVAALGNQLGVLPTVATQALVCTAIVSITVDPIALRLTKPASRWLARFATSRDERAPALSVSPERRAIVVGYGPVGRCLVRLMRENGLQPTVVDMNHETIGALKRERIDAIYGDASHREILERARVETAGSLVFTASGPSDAVIRMARQLNPKLHVFARAHYVSDARALKRAGATDVVSAEGEVALAMVERLLVQLGATGEQLDRARDRARRELVPA